MWFASAIVTLALVSIGQGQQSTPIVNIPGVGSVQGSMGQSSWTNRTIYQFHSIPYAQAPIGQLRFQPPVRRLAWTGTLNVATPGIQCPQIADDYSNVESEDCLTLSVYSNSLETVRPVMVYIHGGWFFFGGAREYEQHYLLESDIVLVVIQYRLGPLGFLSLLNDRIPGNVGILDMILALEWVQQHISHFGGNASSVTVFGESAGSAAVSTLLHSPLVQNRPVPLFHRAILQSGSVFSPWAMCDTPVEGSLDIARRAGCADANTVELCLQQAPIRNLLEAFAAHRKEMITTRGYPSVAGTGVVVGGPSGVFPLHPKSYLASAKTGISVLGGVTEEDGMFLLKEIVKLQPNSVELVKTSHGLLQFVRMLQEKFGQTKLDGALEGYELMGIFLKSEIDEAKWDALVPGLIDICSAHGIKGPVVTTLQAFSAVNPENVYLYSFDYYSEALKHAANFPFPYEGAVEHANDLYFLFPWSTLNERDTRMAKTMVELWTSFAIRGVPSAPGVPSWPPAKELYGPYLKINERCEQRNYYLNEFAATSSKFRTTGNGSAQCYISVLTVALLALIAKLA